MILVGSNAIRVFLALSYIPVLSQTEGAIRLLAIYALTFLTSSLAQFFAPAEGASIPMLVGEKLLLPANSLFTLTIAVAQLLGLMVLGPISISLLRVEGGFVFVAVLYLLAAVSVSTLPKDTPAPRPPSQVSSSRQFWRDIQESWQFIGGRRSILSAFIQLVTIATMILIMAELAPGYAARVLGMSPENAVLVFAPAGFGMLLAIWLTGRWGHVLRRIGFTYLALAGAGLAFAGMGWTALGYNALMRPILRLYPNAQLSLTTAIMALAFMLGVFMAGVNILAQTLVQQESPPYIRGRVLSMQFMLSSLVAIPPMLALGRLADTIGIPRAMEIVGLATVGMALLSLFVARWPIRARSAVSSDSAPAQRGDEA
jgi:hypothetical protein